jgi:hypothetical protein
MHRFTGLAVRFIAFGSALLFPRNSPAAEVEVAGPWRGVTRIRGSATHESQSWIRGEPRESAEITETSQVRFVLVLDRGGEVTLPPGLPPEMAAMMRSTIAAEKASSAQMTWRAESAVITGTHRHESSVINQGSTVSTADFTGEPAHLKDFLFELTPATGVWQIVTPGILREKYQITYVTTGRDAGTTYDTHDGVECEVFDGTVKGKPSAINVTNHHEGLLDKKPTRGFTKVAKIHLWPEFEDVEVEVTIEGYAAFRPEGSIGKPGAPGNHLIARATLVPKGAGKIANLPAVQKFRFELMDTSREPGVCLNWPLGAKDEDYDLRLIAAPSFPAELSDKDQNAEITQTLQDEKGRPYAESQIDSYDFGGRTSLQVICRLADGREIIGVMKDGGAGQDLVRIPKMDGPDWIAESWRKEHNAEKIPANEDNEKIDGQEHDGDGFTLYEEYRGWVENGQRIEGDPKKKDFFVLNLFKAKGEAQPGIDLFAAVSKLNVHSKLRRSEMSEKTRLMNGNHHEAPHRVDQHGVWVKVFPSVAELGGAGAYTPLTKAGVAGRPGIVLGVGVLAANNVANELTKPFNRPSRDMPVAFDRGLAHELLHSVGVEHHGTADGTISLEWVSPRHPRNTVGRPHFREMMTSNSPVYTILDENGHDIATQYMAHYAQDRVNVERVFKERFIAEGEAYIAGHPGQTGLAWNSVAEYVEYFLEEAVSSGFAFRAANLGRPHGEHSGDQECLMRYYFAEFYPAIGKDHTYYKVTPGTERTGIDICHSRAGTGVNAPKPPGLPQSRYSDAPGDGGDCFAQICPNDAIPPRAVK